jgi:hypothetical protein
MARIKTQPKQKAKAELVKGPKQTEKGPKQTEKGPKQTEKGPKQTEKGASQQAVVEDLFRRVSGLGGFLVVAFVAPVPSSISDAGDAGRKPISESVAQEAQDRNEAELGSIKQKHASTAKRKN